MMGPSTLSYPSPAVVGVPSRRAHGRRGGLDTTTPLHVRLDLAMTVDDADVWDDLCAAQAVDERDELVTLLDLTDLWMAPVPTLAGGVSG